MSAQTIDLKLKINFPVIIFTVVFVHAIFMFVKMVGFQELTKQVQERLPLKVQSIQHFRTVGIKNSKIKNSTLLTKSKPNTQNLLKDLYAPSKMKNASNIAQKAARPKSLSLSDLNNTKQAITPVVQRPGTRPLLAQEKSRALTAIKLRGQDEMKNFAQGSNAAQLSGDPRMKSLSNTNVMVNLEVPEGVDESELNKYEMMFYGFQRRTAILYINSLIKNLNSHQRMHPHSNFPFTGDKHVMTGRLTYDRYGNVMQIKMIRWTTNDRVQDFFVDVLKDMDTLHNPPQALWEKNDEFSIFFSLEISG